MQTLLERFLLALGVEHTHTFASEAWRRHPYGGTMWGMMKLLGTYGVKASAVRIADKGKLQELPMPLLAEVSRSLLLVKSADERHVVCEQKGKDVKMTVGEFTDRWSGVVLTAVTDSHPGEPDIESHRRKERFVRMERIVLATAGVTAMAVALSGHHGPMAPFVLSLALNLAALYVCYLLIQETLHAENRLADRLCSLFTPHGCSSLLETKAAKIAGRYGWSECGFGFFAGNLLMLTLWPEGGMICLSAVIACALPFTVWSIWYQGRRAKTWCPLCLTVQGLVWLQFLVLLFSGHYSGTAAAPATAEIIVGLAAQALTVAALAAVTHRVTAAAKSAKEAQAEIAALKRLKYDLSVFAGMLERQPRYETGPAASALLFGNPQPGKPEITIFSNPYCDPCARMHRRAQALMDAGFGIRYVFTYFTDELKGANRYIIATYLKEGAERTWRLLSGWYAGGKEEGRRFFTGVTDEEACAAAVDAELEKHDRWADRTGLDATPKVIVDGRPLPDGYKIEDLIELF